MKTILSVTMAALLIAGLFLGPASAAHRRHHAQVRHSGQASHSGMATGNAALSGNNGNSGSGSNSVGHIQGGNIGAGK